MELVEKIKSGQVGVMPTDTIYGLVGSALSPAVVEKIYELKSRPADMPFIILISDWGDLKKLGIVTSDKDKETLEKNWPGPISFILPCPDESFTYLHREKKSLAVRWPNNEELDKLIKETGPLIATSANLSGRPAVTMITEAKGIFGDKIDFYIDGGVMAGTPSTLAKIDDGQVETLRQGDYIVKNDL